VEQIEALLRQELAEGVEVTDEQVSSAMPRYASELGTPARIRVRQLFVTDADKARGLQLELSQGADFGELARRTHGGDGDMGWMDASAAPQVMLDATLGLQPGGVTELVHSPLGYHIFQLLERKEATTMPADEARAEVRRRLRDEAVESRLRAWIAARSDALVVDVDEDAAMRIQCCRMGLPYLRSPGEETP
jgi:parvulin-like peptidyl-prolyl isomerase